MFVSSNKLLRTLFLFSFYKYKLKRWKQKLSWSYGEVLPTKVNILEIWKDFSCAECSVMELSWECIWNQIKELKTTMQIYTDSSVMIVTPCGTYWRLGFWKPCFFSLHLKKDRDLFWWSQLWRCIFVSIRCKWLEVH